MMLFFDIGNTLEDECPAVEWRIAEAISQLQKRDIQVTREAFYFHLNEAARLRSESAFKTVIRKFSETQQIADEVMASCIWRKDLLRLRPGVADVVPALASNYRLGIIANQSEGACERFEKYGLAKYFSPIISSFDVGVSKPDIAIFSLALEEAGVSPESSVMIGDRIDNDIGPAKTLGFTTIRILGCYNDAQEPMTPEEVPDFTIRQIHEIHHLLGDLPATRH